MSSRLPLRGRPLGAAALGAALLAVATAAPSTTAPPSATASGTSPLGFELEAHRISPKRPLFDGPKRIRLSYRFAAKRPVDLRIKVLHAKTGRVVAAWRQRAAQPGEQHRRGWNGVDRRGRSVADGRYEFRLGPAGRPDRYAGRFVLHGHVYPVDGPHSKRGPVGEFGAGRNGGRTHEGYDIVANCGTRLRAVRGGLIRRVGYDPVLYGHFVLIAGRKTEEPYFYSHLLAPPSLREGRPIRTGDRVGEIGQTGNAGSTPCHLHFELRLGARPIDPGPELGRWDRWS
jgi:murein DD-endopeptidase MepM/ murein hydrolase activator NlpD